MKKKALAMILALTLALSLTACGGTEDPADENGTDQNTTQTEETVGDPAEAEESEETPAEDPELPAEEEPAAEEDTSEGGAGNSGSTTAGSSKPAGGQSTAQPEKPAAEKPAAEKPAAEQPESQPTPPPAEETSGSAPETPAEEPASGVDLAAFADSVSSDQSTWPSLMAVESDALDALYAGLSAIATKQCVVRTAMISASGDEIALVEVENSGDVQAVKDIFQARIDYQVGDGTAPGGAWYPEPTEMWRSESRIVSNGNFVMLVAHTGADSVVEQFNALFA